ncbi:MAG: methylmalonyl-CoA mutase family protein, partial [Planctomycetota bacterium]|nr:methylmalonyl-CoA mutase family protein [Planctomycetota bacterium]
PGQYPYTRGAHPSMYRGRLWTIRQYAGFGTAQETNRRFKYLLDQGSKGLSVAFDLPTQIGYDSDDPIASGEVGRVGVAIDTLDDLEMLFEGIPLDEISTSMTINATAPILLAMYIATAQRQGVDPSKLTGTIQNDILKEYIARGTYRFPPQPALRLTRDIFTYASQHLPKFNTISISGYHMREAGATAAQEIGLTLANAICYIEQALHAGLKIDEFAPRLTFFFASHSDLFEEVAKFRAARRLYAKLMTQRFGAKDPRSSVLRFHTQTGGVTLTAQQPDNNVVRVAYQALAAVLGGTQSLHTNAYDEALALPSEAASRVALNTQHILAHETGVTNTVDPLGGSYFIEQLTDALEADAEAIIKQCEERGGAVNAIEAGWPQSLIEQSAYELGQRVESGERLVVGVNEFAREETETMEIFRPSEQTASEQVSRLEASRAKRNDDEVKAALAELDTFAQGEENIMPSLLKAVHALASMGEMCRVLRDVFGEYDDGRA